MGAPETGIPRLLVRAVAVPVLAMALFSVALALEVRELLRLASWVDHTDKVIAEAQETGRLLADREAGLRGYALSHDAGYLDSYKSAERELPSQWSQLEALVSDDAGQLARVRQVRALAADWEKLAQLQLERGDGPLAPGQRRELMARARAELARMVGVEEQLRSVRTAAVTSGARLVTGVSIALVLLLGLLLGLWSRRQITRVARGYERALEVDRKTITLREEFLNVAAHELRTPLTALLLQLQRLQREAERRGADAGMAETAVRQARRLAGLIDNLLDAHALASGTELELHRQTIDLYEVARAAGARVALELAHLRCPIEVKPGPKVEGLWDRGRLELAAAALLSNACKFGEGHPVVVEIVATDAAASLVVTDRGIGIARELQESIFARFERGVSPRAYGGFGLGLYAAKRIAELHGGTIEVESAEGLGSRFTLRIPRGAWQAAGPRAASA